MSLHGGERRILNVIENDLRVSDPQLVLAFSAFATNGKKADVPPPERRGVLRRLFGRRWREPRRQPDATGGDPRRSWTRMMVVLPLAVLAVLSLIILTLPASHQRPCGFVGGSAAGAGRLSQCLPAGRIPRDPLRPARSVAKVPQPAQNAAAVHPPRAALTVARE